MSKRTFRITFLLLSVLVLAGYLYIAGFENQEIVRETDYAAYLESGSRAAFFDRGEENQERLDFWQGKLDGEPNSGLYKLQVASILAERFEITGDISQLLRSDSLLQSALEGPLLKKSSVYHALSANALTRHDFHAARQYADRALQTGEGPEVSRLLLYDALLELGQVDEAEEILAAAEDKTSFSYRIRSAKFQDHQGDLPRAIRTMESTADWCRKVDNRKLLCWTLGNLGDMYGHAGLVRRSYEAYLEVLKIDPAYHHALKGIAWIAYAHDHDIGQASRIAEHLLAVRKMPDLYLFLADMAAYSGEQEKQQAYLDQFRQEAARPAYGRMYHKYLAEINLDQTGGYRAAWPYVEMEMENRPTAQTYALLARCYKQAGKTAEALKIVREHVEGRTYEPQVLMQVGLIYQSAGLEKEAKKYLREVCDARLELGPSATQEIQEAIAKL